MSSILRVRMPNGSELPIPSIKGEAGHTPIKGTDYWTEADKQEISDDLSNLLTADNIAYSPPTGTYAQLGVNNVAAALNAGLIPPGVDTLPSRDFQPQKIYSLGEKTNLNIILPNDNDYWFTGGEWVQVDFISGPTPTNLTINSNGSHMTPLDITISANKVYSLFFDRGVVGIQESGGRQLGWRISYAEYALGVY